MDTALIFPYTSSPAYPVACQPAYPVACQNTGWSVFTACPCMDFMKMFNNFKGNSCVIQETKVAY